MILISKPTRDQLEEMFPTTGRIVLDDRARADLRSSTEVWRQVKRATAPLWDLDSLCSPLPGSDKSTPYNYLRLVSNHLKLVNDKSGETVLPLNDWISNEVARGDEADTEYFCRSVATLVTLRSLGLVDVGGTVAAAELTLLAPLNLLNEATLNAFYIRRYPMIRFRPMRFLQVYVHHDELDSAGVPRVSLDGYNLNDSSHKI